MANERKFIAENIKRVLLKEYLMKEVSRAGFGGVEVQRTPMGTRVTLITERPGIVIGRRGAAIKNLTRAIENDFKFANPQIEVQEVDNPNLNAQIMAEKLAFALERGWHFRRAGHSTVRRIMESSAKGCQVVLSGKLTGQRHRTEKFKAGYIKFCGEPRLQFIKTGFATATLKRGTIGVKVEIMTPGARLPDEIGILSPAKAADLMPELFAQITEEDALEKDVEIPVEEAEELENSEEDSGPEESAETEGKETGDEPEVPAEEAGNEENTEAVEETELKGPEEVTE